MVKCYRLLSASNQVRKVPCISSLISFLSWISIQLYLSSLNEMMIYIFLWLMCKIYEFSNIKLTLCSLKKYKVGMIYTKYISGVRIYLCEQVDYFFLNVENPGQPVVFTLLTSEWRTLFQNMTVLDSLNLIKTY